MYIALFLSFILAFAMFIAGMAATLFSGVMIYKNRKPGSGYATLSKTYPLNHIRYPAGLNDTARFYCRIIPFSIGLIFVPPFLWLVFASVTVILTSI